MITAVLRCVVFSGPRCLSEKQKEKKKMVIQTTQHFKDSDLGALIGTEKFFRKAKWRRKGAQVK